MKSKIFIGVVMLLFILTGCSSRSNDETLRKNDLLKEIRIGANAETVIELLGEPKEYIDYGRGKIKDSSRDFYFMDYDGFMISIGENQINEVRILSEDYGYDDFIKVGQSKDKALRALSPPLKIVEGNIEPFTYFVLYNGITEGSDGSKIRKSEDVSYYNDPLNGVRVSFKKGKVTSIYHYEYDNRHEKGDGFDLKYGLAGRFANSGEFKSVVKDGVTYDFVDDKDLVGDWKYTNVLIRKEDIASINNLEKLDFSDVQIMDNGQIAKSMYNWTDGYLLNSFSDTVFEYEITEIDNDKYLIVSQLGNPDVCLYVLQKVE